MTLNSSMTGLMNAARNYYQVSRKLNIDDLASLLSPNPNLIENSDDFSGNKYSNKATSIITPSDKSYQGLTTYNYSGNAGGYGVMYFDEFKPGDYTFSVFINVIKDPAGQRDAFEALPINHIPFYVEQGWHRYIIPFTADSSFSSIQVCFWTSTGGSFAGYKLEEGSQATPYLRQDGTLVKAPEIIVGGGRHN